MTDSLIATIQINTQPSLLLLGSPTEVRRALDAHPQGRRGAGGPRPLQGPAGRQGGAVLQEEVLRVHRAHPEGEGQRSLRLRRHPPVQGQLGLLQSQTILNVLHNRPFEQVHS